MVVGSLGSPTLLQSPPDSRSVELLLLICLSGDNSLGHHIQGTRTLGEASVYREARARQKLPASSTRQLHGQGDVKRSHPGTRSPDSGSTGPPGVLVPVCFFQLMVPPSR